MPLHDNFAARVSLALAQETETPVTKSEDVLRVCSCHGNQGQWLVLTSSLKWKPTVAPFSLEADKKDEVRLLLSDNMDSEIWEAPLRLMYKFSRNIFL